MKLSSQMHGYICELAAEWILGQPLETFSSAFMVRGTTQEEEAVRYYEFQTGIETEIVGFCLRDDGLAGCSPDRFVGTDGGLEIKVPNAKTHIQYLLRSVADEYKAQVQGNLYITGREWWDIVSYNPMMPPAIIRCPRDEAFISALDIALAAFLEKLAQAKDRLLKLGIEPQLGKELEGWPFD